MCSPKIFAAVTLGAVLAASGCGRGGGGAEPGTASYCVESLIRAAKTGDVDLYLSVLPSEASAAAEASRGLLGDKFDELMKPQLAATASGVKDARVTGEVVTGNKAKVTLTDAKGETVVIDCIKEADGWKLDLKMNMK